MSCCVCGGVAQINCELCLDEICVYCVDKEHDCGEDSLIKLEAQIFKACQVTGAREHLEAKQCIMHVAEIIKMRQELLERALEELKRRDFMIGRDHDREIDDDIDTHLKLLK